MLATLDATLLPLEKGGLTANSLVYRYNIKEAGDGLSGEEGTFNICTFWLVEALTRAGRHDRSRLEEARLIFERMLGFANHLGLYAEETGHRGEALGNFPQAFTHLALVRLRSTWTARWGPADDQARPSHIAAGMPRESQRYRLQQGTPCKSLVPRVGLFAEIVQSMCW
jgi:hypothetical protein